MMLQILVIFLFFVSLSLYCASGVLLRSCGLVYIDMGTNIGHQIRKLYEPELYPNNPTEEIFSKYFGSRRHDVCAFGFEPNPHHTASLSLLEKHYRNFGYRLRIHPVGVSTTNSTAFFGDFNAIEGAQHNEWAARMQTKETEETVKIRTIDIAAWMRSTIPTGSVIVMKSDIEGHDTEVLNHLVIQKQFCRISFIYGEHFNPDDFRNVCQNAVLQPIIILLDDETGDDSLMDSLNKT